MTRDEMLKRLEELGGTNPITSLRVTIEKWRDLPKYWQDWQKMMAAVEAGKDARYDFALRHYPLSTNCGLCEYYKNHVEETDKQCTRHGKLCPLYAHQNSPCREGTDYGYAVAAINDGDYDRFIIYRNKLLQAMERALEELEKEQNHERTDNS